MYPDTSTLYHADDISVNFLKPAQPLLCPLAGHTSTSIMPVRVVDDEAPSSERRLAEWNDAHSAEVATFEKHEKHKFAPNSKGCAEVCWLSCTALHNAYTLGAVSSVWIVRYDCFRTVSVGIVLLRSIAHM